MIIELDLSQHCIETEIRRQYNCAVSSLLRKKAPADTLEPIIELTQSCLEQLDFAVLRSAHRALAGGTRSRVQLLAHDGEIRIVIDHRETLRYGADAGADPSAGIDLDGGDA